MEYFLSNISLHLISERRVREYTTCPRYQRMLMKGCQLTENKRLEFPKCCPRVKCPKRNRVSLTEIIKPRVFPGARRRRPQNIRGSKIDINLNKILEEDSVINTSSEPRESDDSEEHIAESDEEELELGSGEESELDSSEIKASGESAAQTADREEKTKDSIEADSKEEDAASIASESLENSEKIFESVGVADAETETAEENTIHNEQSDKIYSAEDEASQDSANLASDSLENSEEDFESVGIIDFKSTRVADAEKETAEENIINNEQSDEIYSAEDEASQYSANLASDSLENSEESVGIDFKSTRVADAEKETAEENIIDNEQSGEIYSAEDEASQDSANLASDSLENSEESVGIIDFKSTRVADAEKETAEENIINNEQSDEIYSAEDEASQDSANLASDSLENSEESVEIIDLKSTRVADAEKETAEENIINNEQSDEIYSAEDEASQDSANLASDSLENSEEDFESVGIIDFKLTRVADAETETAEENIIHNEQSDEIYSAEDSASQDSANLASDSPENSEKSVGIIDFKTTRVADAEKETAEENAQSDEIYSAEDEASQEKTDKSSAQTAVNYDSAEVTAGNDSGPEIISEDDETVSTVDKPVDKDRNVESDSVETSQEEKIDTAEETKTKTVDISSKEYSNTEESEDPAGDSQPTGSSEEEISEKVSDSTVVEDSAELKKQSNENRLIEHDSLENHKNKTEKPVSNQTAEERSNSSLKENAPSDRIDEHATEEEISNNSTTTKNTTEGTETGTSESNINVTEIEETTTTTAETPTTTSRGSRLQQLFRRRNRSRRRTFPLQISQFLVKLNMVWGTSGYKVIMTLWYSRNNKTGQFVRYTGKASDTGKQRRNNIFPGFKQKFSDVLLSEAAKTLSQGKSLTSISKEFKKIEMTSVEVEDWVEICEQKCASDTEDTMGEYENHLHKMVNVMNLGDNASSDSSYELVSSFEDYDEEVDEDEYVRQLVSKLYPQRKTNDQLESKLYPRGRQLKGS
ncbi:hypothetical protein GQR58_003856 [Nymphon striatum]|nr:hypothetical protein GQR58_003856 [Nymphon striatum]